MTIERNDYAAAGEVVIAQAEATTAGEVAECSIAERGIVAAKHVLKAAGDIGKIIINGDLAETLRQSANHLS